MSPNPWPEPAEPRMTHVADVSALAEINPEATLSRTILRGQGCRVVLFTFDSGQELTEHTAAMPVLLQVLDGRLKVGAAGESVELVPGALVHLTARLAHTVLAVEPSRLLLIMLDPRA